MHSNIAFLVHSKYSVPFICYHKCTDAFMQCICTSDGASEASERLRNYMYVSDLKINCIQIQSMQWYGTLNDSMTDKTLTLRELYEYASEA